MLIPNQKTKFSWNSIIPSFNSNYFDYIKTEIGTSAGLSLLSPYMLTKPQSCPLYIAAHSHTLAWQSTRIIIIMSGRQPFLSAILINGQGSATCMFSYQIKLQVETWAPGQELKSASAQKTLGLGRQPPTRHPQAEYFHPFRPPPQDVCSTSC